ncbi:MAG: hypothetical protein ISR47_00635 [Rhodospirillales bacterium]|nr:hypothetical protein [Rhodospirillales bacterium]
MDASEKFQNGEIETSGKEAAKFLDILHTKILDVYELTGKIAGASDDIQFDDYRIFREAVGECLSFLIIIERHLTRVEEAKRVALQTKFDELTVAVWSILLDGALKFLGILATKEFLPIGTKFIFVDELRTLYDADKVLKDEKFKTFVSATILKRRSSAEKILNEVIDRAPQLLQLG